jgi:hypothetical protein
MFKLLTILSAIAFALGNVFAVFDFLDKVKGIYAPFSFLAFFLTDSASPLVKSDAMFNVTPASSIFFVIWYGAETVLVLKTISPGSIETTSWSPFTTVGSWLFVLVDVLFKFTAR